MKYVETRMKQNIYRYTAYGRIWKWSVQFPVEYVFIV